MKKHFDNALEKVTSVDDVEKATIDLLKKIRKSTGKIGFVSGIIFSDGDEHRERNLKRLATYVEKLRKVYDFPIFSGIDIFYSGLYEKLPESKLPYEERRKKFFAFWKEIVTCGYITDIFMTPRWKKSEGSRDEHTRAKEVGITIHYVENDEEINKL